MTISGSIMAQESGPITKMDEAFDHHKEQFILSLWKVNPAWASTVGYHKYDSVLIVPNAASRMQEEAFCKAQLAKLKTFQLANLRPENVIDYKLIENQLQYQLFCIHELKSFEWDPSSYNICGLFADMLNNDYEPLDKRLHNLGIRLKRVAPYYAAAKANLKNPTQEHTQLAIDQHMGGISVFTDDLKAMLDKSTLKEAERKQIQASASIAVKAINDYVSFLKTMKNPQPRSFRLGNALYEKKFAFEIMSQYSANEIYQKANAHKLELHQKMYELAEQLWPKYMEPKPMPTEKMEVIRRMIERLSEEHTTPSKFQNEIEAQIPTLVKFIQHKDLIFIDPEKPLVVRKEPAYMAGVAGASISAPGPYDANGNTYYNVGSLENWPAEQAESYLREYNKYILQILNIHEAIPGHYTQLVYANRSPSIIKSILGNNAMIEGWAVYTERMMLEQGYDIVLDFERTTASPEMWLMYYKWNLRSTCNAILDYDVHAKGMKKDEAMHLLVDEAFQQKAEAEGKWKRVSVTQVQLSCYFTGFTEIYELREKAKMQQANNFQLKEFHEKFLSYGSAPVKYIKQMMEIK